MIDITDLKSISNIQEAIFPVYKPLGWSSTDVCNVLKREFKIKKIGHAGTLDPLAEGVLLVCTGKNTKQIPLLQTGQKTYIAQILFGATTTTLDTEEFPSFFKDTHEIDEEKIKELIQLNFIGKITQTPPIYSALKSDGKALYELAREKTDSKTLEEIVKKKTRIVEIFDFKIIGFKDITIENIPFNKKLLRKKGDIENDKIEIEPDVLKQNSQKLFKVLECEITCSTGTYIRSIARDLGLKLGFDSYLIGLNRVKEYGFTVQKSIDE